MYFLYRSPGLLTSSSLVYRQGLILSLYILLLHKCLVFPTLLTSSSLVYRQGLIYCMSGFLGSLYILLLHKCLVFQLSVETRHTP